MKIVLIRNFEPDHQQSMLRFADCVAGGLQAVGEDVEVLAPRLRFGNLFGRYHYSGFSKWLGYIDKFVMFPATISRRLATLHKRHDGVLVHVLDHGNASYVPRSSFCPWLVTCNDLLAVKAARGLGSDVEISRTGRLLQSSVFRGLKRADHVACISSATRDDFVTLLPKRESSSSVVWMGLNHPYKQLPEQETTSRLRQICTTSKWQSLTQSNTERVPENFVLHVGSNHRRKNRPGVARTVAQAITAGWNGDLVMAGETPDPELIRIVEELNISRRFWWIKNPDNSELEALYNRATALLFPSYAEGFGWPVVEAQACGCPVITSNTTSLPEVAGDQATLFSPDDTEGMAGALAALETPQHRENIIQSGLLNAQRFTTAGMIEKYRSIYRSLATAQRTQK